MAAIYVTVFVTVFFGYLCLVPDVPSRHRKVRP